MCFNNFSPHPIGCGVFHLSKTLDILNGKMYNNNNNDSIRIERTENCKVHKYILDGTNILKEIVEDTCCNCNGYTIINTHITNDRSGNRSGIAQSFVRTNSMRVCICKVHKTFYFNGAFFLPFMD